MRHATVLAGLLLLAAPAASWGAAPAGFNAGYSRVSSHSFVQDKNFYVLTLLQSNSRVRAELAADEALAAIAKRTIGLSAARSMALTNEEIAAAKDKLIGLATYSTALQSLIKDHLRPSGTYQRLSRLNDAQMLGEAWAEAARGINHIVGRFVLASDIDYTDIDSPSYPVDSPLYQKSILKARDDAARAEGSAAGVLFFEPSLVFALNVLAINRRDEAGRHEPLALGENAAALKKMRGMNAQAWRAYPYAALLVHGIGGDKPGVAISAGSRENSASAAALYAKKMAPFIIVSGGYVHPKQTIFAEAIEMKRELMLVHGLPADAILIEPHARHTTTNVRNAVRILFAGGAPADKPSLSVAGKSHIDSIVSEKFVKRCVGVFGYMPAKYGRRISDVAAEFLPSIDSLHIDPRDPLDP